MIRCEEIFRQICWLEERFWPDVDGMGEVDESARLNQAGLGPLGAGVTDLDNMDTPGLNGPTMNGPMSGPMNPPMNGPMNPPMNGPMSGPAMNNGMGGSNMNAPSMNGPGMNNGNGTPVSDGRNSFSLPHGNGLENS